MYLLSIDTSAAWLCVAVSDGERLLASYCRRKERGHGRFLVPAIARTLERSGINIGRLHGLAAVSGPGSFTGLRIGLATVKGLAMALDIPVALLVSLDVLAEAAVERASMVMPLIDARRQQVYAALYRADTKRSLRRCSPLLLDKPRHILRRLSAPTAIPGDGANIVTPDLRQAYPQAIFLDDSFQRPRPEVLAKLAYRAHAAGKIVSAAEVSARYLYKDTCAVRLAGPQQHHQRGRQ